jgi:N-methylhydantoinase A
VRYRKQAHTLIAEVDGGTLTLDSATPIQQRFERRYASVYGEGALLSAGAGIELEAQYVNGTRPVEPPPLRAHERAPGDGSQALRGERQAYFDGYVATPVFDGGALRAGDVVSGPALVQRMGDSLVVPQGFTATVDEYLTIGLRSA